MYLDHCARSLLGEVTAIHIRRENLYSFSLHVGRENWEKNEDGEKLSAEISADYKYITVYVKMIVAYITYLQQSHMHVNDEKVQIITIKQCILSKIQFFK